MSTVNALRTQGASVAAILLDEERVGPFTRWHNRRKYEVMGRLFRKYLVDRPRFLDMCCGDGEALALARSCNAAAALSGLDLDESRLEKARARCPEAVFCGGDMHAPDALPKDSYDVLHEFGATFYTDRWNDLARAYLSRLCDGGILLWELPQRWSAAHLSYLCAPAQKREGESKFKRVLRSLLPGKYHFHSDREVHDALVRSGYRFEVLERIPIWHFFCPWFVCAIVEWLWKFTGDAIFDGLDRMFSHVWPRWSGYYLVVRRIGPALEK